MDLLHWGATALVVAVGLAIVAPDLRLAIKHRHWPAIALLSAAAVGYAVGTWHAIRLVRGG